MNAGRVEQIDDPISLYARPRTRFVAGFIGRTNFVDGAVQGDRVEFDHFAIATDRFEGGRDLRGAVSFSLRPQSIHLHRHEPSATNGAVVLPGRIVQRAYLGEHWDYAVTPKDSALALRVTARPQEVFQMDEAVWLELDPRQMAHIL
jgi:iron(III) transport system ATP-binding protein